MKDIKLSIIVPIYNTEKYLTRCIESLLNIHGISYEVLLIDDGSTDRSGEICDRYAGNYDFVKTIHKENGGVTSARKLGVINANGKYIAFVDSDDWIGEDIYTDLISAMDNNDDLDVCIGGLEKIFNDGLKFHICPIYPMTIMTNVEAMREMLQWKRFRWELCGNLYRASLFYDFNPPEDIRIGEDLVSNFYLLRNANKVLYQPTYQYYYFTNLDSVTQSGKYKMNTLMRSFYFVNRMGIENKALNILIGELYAKEIIKDIFYGKLFENMILNRIPLYRSELKSLVSINSVYLFLNQHFNILAFVKALDNDNDFLEYWNFVFNEIVERLNVQSRIYKNIYIYGTGVISKFLVELFKKYNIKYNSLVVSDGQIKENSYVKYLSEISDEDKDTSYILALASVYNKEIIHNLQNRGYTNYLIIGSISDMYR